MSYFRRGSLFNLSFLVVLSSSAAAQQTATPTAPGQAAPAAAKPDPVVKSDPAAVKTLASANELFGPKRKGWIKTNLWQKVDLQGLSYSAEGLYLTGPERQLHLDLRVKVGATQGELKAVSDGTTLWQQFQVGGGERVVTKVELNKTLEVLNTPGMQPEVRDIFYQSQAMAGLGPLLRNLQQQLVLTKQEEGIWNGREVYLLSGTWNADISKVLSQLPPSFPRRCKLTLDRKTLWLYRLDWYGPAPNEGETLLLQMEFRDPQLLTAEDKLPQEFAALLKFDPQNVVPVDQTKQEADRLRDLSKQLAASRSASPQSRPPTR